MKRSIKLTIALWLCLCLGTNPGPGTALAQEQTAEETSAGSADSLYAQNKFQEALDLYLKELAELKTPTCDVSLARTVELTLDCADCLCRLHKYEAAEQCIQKTLAKNGLPTAQKVRLNCAQAGLFYRQGKFAESKRLLEECLKMMNGSLARPTAAVVLLHIYLGEILYKQSLYKESIPIFKKAMDELAQVNGESKATTEISYELTRILLEGLSGSYIHLKDWQNAEPVVRTMAILDRSYWGDVDINYAWTLLTLVDVLKAAGREKETTPYYEKAIWIFRKVNYDRLVEEAGADDNHLADATTAGDKATVEHIKTLRKTLKSYVFGEGDRPEFRNGDKVLVEGLSESDNLFTTCTSRKLGEKVGTWNLKPSLQTEAPGIVWANANMPQKGVMVCIHGLGLHHKAFASFAKRIGEEGFTVVSFDVRGFGSYLASKGQDKLDMEACVEDMAAVLSLLRRDYPTKPLFLLGESMGGAIALRIAADYPCHIDGLVCSVPAANRQKETGTKLKVAANYITGKNRPLALERAVLNKSTSSVEERAAWKDNPNSRLTLSAKELLQFNSFMKENRIYARKVNTTPVLVVQGNEDRLVKREGTYYLFENLATRDKALVLLGGREHLIFEAKNFQDDITLGIIGWLNAHLGSCSLTTVKVQKDDSAPSKN